MHAPRKGCGTMHAPRKGDDRSTNSAWATRRKSPQSSAIIVVVSAFLSLSRQALAACPNMCSFHGSCNASNVCICEQGWDVVSDCSQRRCPYGPAWADKAYADDLAHTPAECSNAGICDRSHGTCQCFNGYTGSACQRLSCPNTCSGHGMCLTLEHVGLYFGPQHKVHAPGALGLGPTYTGWDSDSVTMCNCDPGYFGADCSRKMCPKGDDPITVAQSDRAIQLVLETSDGGSMQGTIRLTFELFTTALSIQGSITDRSCTAAVEALPNVRKATCSIHEPSQELKYLNITFNEWPTQPQENNIFTHNGNPPLSHFFCDVQDAFSEYGTRVNCTINDLVNTNVKEYELCSRRGLCDFISGTCQCFDDFAGSNCALVDYDTTISSSNSDPGLSLTAIGLDYTGNVVELIAQKSAASDFYFLLCEADGQTQAAISGTGNLEAASLTALYEGLSVEDGGINVAYGGLTVQDGGAYIRNGYGGSNVMTVTATDATQFGSNIIELISKRVAISGRTAWNFMKMGFSNETIFRIRGDGLVQVQGTQGLEVNDGGIVSTTDGVTVEAGGITVETGGIVVAVGGLNVSTDGTVLRGRASDTQGALKVVSDSTSSTDLPVQPVALISAEAGSGSYSILEVEYNSLGGGGTSVFRVTGDPQTVVDTGGLYIAAGGQTIASGGLNVQGGATTLLAGLDVSGGLTNSGAFTQSGNVVLTTGNIVASSGTLQVDGITSTGVITQTGRIYVQNGNVDISTGHLNAQGITNSGIITQTGNIYLSSGTIAATSSLIRASGLFVTGTISVADIRYTGTVTTPSDRRLKTKIKSLKGALQGVSRLRGVEFQWRPGHLSSFSQGSRTQIGFIAQEVQEVYPELVTGSELDTKAGQGDDEDASRMMGVMYTNFAPILVEAVKEQQTFISAQRAEIDELQARVQRHEEQLGLMQQHLDLLLARMNRKAAG